MLLVELISMLREGREAVNLDHIYRAVFDPYSQNVLYLHKGSLVGGACLTF